MPSDLMFKTMNALHRGVLAASGGRLGNRVADMPVIALTTTGRTSGQSRTVMLTAPARVGDALVVVASRGGDDKHPAWFLNLQADPEVEVTRPGGEAQRCRARITGPEERDQLWARITADHQNYADYQTKTTRVIPVVVLEPGS